MNTLKEEVKNIDKKNEFTYIILGLIELENNPEIAIEYLKLFIYQEQKDIFFEPFKYIVKAFSSLKDDNLEEAINNLEKCVELCINKEFKALEYLCDLMLFQVNLEKDDRINWGLYEKIENNKMKLPLFETDIYETVGLYLRDKKEYEAALASLKIALNIYLNSQERKKIAETYINIGFIEAEIKNYFNSNKSFKLALKEINEIFVLKGISFSALLVE